MNSKQQKPTDYWEAFVDALAEAVLILDKNGVIAYANQAACDLLGKKLSHIMGDYFSYPFESDEEEKHALEIEIMTPDNSLRHAEVRVRAGKWKRKNAWIITLHDITFRKSVEHELKIAANVFNHAKEGIVITDPKGVIINVNQEFSRITQYSKDEVIGQTMRVIQSGKYDSAFYQDLWSSLKTKGYWYGLIWNKRKNGEIYPQLEAISSVKDEAGDVSHYVSVFHDRTEEEKQQKRLEYMANYDELTGLPNRALVIDRLEQAMLATKRTKNFIAILFIDLDKFKKMNDDFGHHFGDLVLKKFSSVIKAYIRDSDTLARYGGDEFILLLTEIKHQNQYLSLLKRLDEQLQKPMMIESHKINMAASIGVTLYPQKHPVSAEQLIRQADQAMYESKLKGHGGYTIFDTDNELHQKDDNQFIHELKTAMHDQKLEMYYQPQVNMLTRKILGVEGLIRWHHPEHGLLLPNDFLPKVRSDEFLSELSDWTIKQALRQLNAWHQAGIKLSISVNINPFEFDREDFVQHITRLIAPYPKKLIQYLEFEILESSTLSDMTQASQFVAQCKALGIKFALDDFGAGYSSITQLLALPFDYMKIDMNFIKNILDNPRDIQILQAILDIARAVEIDVIAEGVETPQHQALLLKLGCVFGQGYAFSEALGIDDFNQWYKDWIKH
ncbi:MAG: EAL domain-containing protein [Legionellaceae bacterium]|nr:EAL domain-containing protein [Legionellaceae bacterium]